MSRTSPPSLYPLPGEIIGDSWRIERILGEGGMGAVARAWDLVLHTPVAIKFMNPQFLTLHGSEERFINEGKASALIKSDHIVPVMKAGKTPTGTPYLVMECLEGVDLAELLARDGTPGIPLERSVHFLLQVLRALQAAHAIGIIHRDMKPSNCFVVNKDGEADFVKILDFGISKVQKPGSASLTQTNSALGTPLYMSPEQARSPRDVDARSDLYSVGVILYELLTGRTPFFSQSGEFTEILFKLFTTEAPPVQSTRPDLPDALAAVVHKALAREASERFSNALEMAEALAPWASERSRHVLTRMRGFKTPSSPALLPPEDLPQSMVAFSQISDSQRTDLTATRPATDVTTSSPVTQIMPRGGAPMLDRQESHSGMTPTALFDDHTTESMYSAHISAVPAAEEQRARPDEAAARTQYDTDSGRRRAVLTGAWTERDAEYDKSEFAGSKRRRSPMVYVAALLAVAGVSLGLATVKRPGMTKANGSDPTASAEITRSSADIPTRNSTLPPPSASVVATTPLTTPTPSVTASPTTTTSAIVKTRPTTNPNSNVGTAHAPTNTVLETGIKK